MWRKTLLWRMKVKYLLSIMVTTNTHSLIVTLSPLFEYLLLSFVSFVCFYTSRVFHLNFFFFRIITDFLKYRFHFSGGLYNIYFLFFGLWFNLFMRLINASEIQNLVANSIVRAHFLFLWITGKFSIHSYEKFLCVWSYICFFSCLDMGHYIVPMIAIFFQSFDKQIVLMIRPSPSLISRRYNLFNFFFLNNATWTVWSRCRSVFISLNNIYIIRDIFLTGFVLHF